MVEVIRVLEGNTTNPRLAEDARLSRSQLQACMAAAKVDPGAAVLGLDQKMRPVLCTVARGPGRAVRYALLRNGEATRVSSPLTEEWKER